jgi:cytochrome c-type biogenesis protein CcmE
MSPPLSKSTRKIISGVLTLGLLIGGISYLFASSAGEAFEYYKHVDEIMANPGQWEHKHVQMHGFVVPGSIKKRIAKENQQVEYKFTVVNCGKEIEAHYAGTVPDTFKDRAEVVLKGTLADNKFDAHDISAKCPSKYQARLDGPAATLCTRGDANVEGASVQAPAAAPSPTAAAAPTPAAAAPSAVAPSAATPSPTAAALANANPSAAPAAAK